MKKWGAMYVRGRTRETGTEGKKERKKKGEWTN